MLVWNATHASTTLPACYSSSGPFNWIGVFFHPSRLKMGGESIYRPNNFPLCRTRPDGLFLRMLVRDVFPFSLLCCGTHKFMSQLAKLLCSCPTDVPHHRTGRSWAEVPRSRMGNLSGCVRETLRNPINPRVQKNNVHFFYF